MPTKNRVWVLLAIWTLCAGTVLHGAIPTPGTPLIHSVHPRQLQAGQEVAISGVHFGGAPSIHFNATPVDFKEYDARLGYVTAVVPPGVTGEDLSLTVFDAGSGLTSNVALVDIAATPFVPACTIDGTLSDGEGLSEGALAVVLDLDTFSGLGADRTDVLGEYAIEIGSPGSYWIAFFPADTAEAYRTFYAVDCPGTQDHLFSSGVSIQGRVVEAGSSAPVDGAFVAFYGETEVGVEVNTLADGTFTVNLPVSAEPYDFLVRAPVGTDLVSVESAQLISGSADLGDISLARGSVLSGMVRRASDDAVLDEVDVEAMPISGAWIGKTVTIADGSFYLAAVFDGSDRLLRVEGEEFGLENLWVDRVAPNGDSELLQLLEVLSPVIEAPTVPTIIAVDSSSSGFRVGQPIGFAVGGPDGSASQVLFSNGLGSTLPGGDTEFLGEFDYVLTRVPALPIGTELSITIEVDGVESAPVSVPFLPGTYSAGTRTTQGTVRNEGGVPVEDVLVILDGGDSCSAGPSLAYVRTDAAGYYSLAHGAGGHSIEAFPRLETRLVGLEDQLVDGGGDRTRDFVLRFGGNDVTASCVSSGVGPVDTVGPIPGCGIWLEHEDGDTYGTFEVTDDAGNATLSMYDSSDVVYGIDLPAGNRFLYSDGETLVDIVGDTDLPPAAHDSGYIIHGRVVDTVGNPVVGADAEAFGQDPPFRFFDGTDSDESGEFRIAVEPGARYRVEIEPPDEIDLVSTPVLTEMIRGDTRIHPSIVLQPAANIEGTVTDTAGAPVPDILVLTSSGAGTVTCDDGSYSLKVTTGDHHVSTLILYSETDRCLADRNYQAVPDGCGSDPVPATAGSTTPGIDIELRPIATISGTVLDEFGSPRVGAQVCAEYSGRPPCVASCTQADASGAYSFDQVGAGVDFSLTVCDPDFTNCESTSPTLGECETRDISFPLSVAPGWVPDGFYVAGSPMTVDRGPLPGQLTISWQPTCDVDDHALYFGAIGTWPIYDPAQMDQIPSSAYDNAICSIGSSGTVVIDSPPGDVYFTVVGAAGAEEGLYGVAEDPAVGPVARPPALPGLCGRTTNLNATCVP